MKKFLSNIRLNAQFQYVAAIAWFVAAIGCFTRNVGYLALIFSAMGGIHLVVAVIVDIIENKRNKAN